MTMRKLIFQYLALQSVNVGIVITAGVLLDWRLFQVLVTIFMIAGISLVRFFKERNALLRQERADV
ncbi:hypothetical protein SAMN05216481_101209 [Streptomyces radiopugnans]|uniref:Uncharacterized protein n=1 Tax=Streptomyces radiopugnans TaxID=403935 RepID=A0A1H8Z273_9ACTN|nr:hypothetical protein SAMN05216481_101209 [Streptomyces radiopugnans]